MPIDLAHVPSRLAVWPSRKGLLAGSDPRGRVGWACTSQPSPMPHWASKQGGRSRQRAQALARHRRPGSGGTNTTMPDTCNIVIVSHPSAFPVHNDPNVDVHFWIGNEPFPRAVKFRLLQSGSNAIPNGRRSFLRGGSIRAVPSSRRSGGGRPRSRPSPRTAASSMPSMAFSMRMISPAKEQRGSVGQAGRDTDGGAGIASRKLG